MPTSPELAKLAAGLYPDDFAREYQKESAANFGGELSPAQLEAAVNRVVVDHAADLHHALMVGQGRAVNVEALPASYTEQLAKRNVTEDMLVEACERMYPNVSRAEAIS